MLPVYDTSVRTWMEINQRSPSDASPSKKYICTNRRNKIALNFFPCVLYNAQYVSNLDQQIEATFGEACNAGVPTQGPHPLLGRG